MTRFIGSWLGASLLSGCVATGFTPSDTLGVAAHELAASAYERSAAVHRRNAGDYTPAGCSTLAGCPAGTINVKAANELEQAERDQRMASEHRARSAELRDAEQRACAGLDDADLDVYLVAIDVPERLETDTGLLKGITVRSSNERGMAIGEFQRIVRCRVARNAARGLDVGGPDSCPLIPGAQVDVHADGPNFRVTITPLDEVAAKALARCSLAGRDVLLRPSTSGGAS